MDRIFWRLVYRRRGRWLGGAPISLPASFGFAIDRALLLLGDHTHPAHPIPRYRAIYLFQWADQTCGMVP
jgi:hypothetical protein